MEIGVYWGC